LPAGRYYLRALESVDSLEWSNPEVLETIRDEATEVGLNDGETKSIDVRTSRVR
jgi:hypothetical protein